MMKKQYYDESIPEEKYFVFGELKLFLYSFKR